jgi:hypothetical protein
MKNMLKKFEEDDTQFFVIKSFVYALFETDRRKPEFHIFFVKKNSNPDAYYKGYMNLKERKMNKKEIEYFKKNQEEKYDTVLWSEDGKVFNLKTKPFDTELCPKYKQFMLEL